jgi:hypothetical protein
MRHLTLGRVRPATWPSGRGVLGRYAAAWAYLAAFVLAELIGSALPRRDQSLLLRWASTNVVNLHHHPVGALVVSALIAPAFAWAWPALIALALFGANRVLGNWGTALLCITGHVAGTLVSEGIVAYRTGHGLLPETANRIVDVGPSYVVVAAITVAVLFGSWPARAAAVLDLGLLVFVGDIFSGLTTLQVAAVGHVTAIVVSVPLGILLARRARRQPTPATAEPAEPAEPAVPDVRDPRR